ncbi:FCA [Symbiodinium sp. CCMP2592]|nr:FCA [Symbiodinium sp. CCMP2592]
MSVRCFGRMHSRGRAVARMKVSISQTLSMLTDCLSIRRQQNLKLLREREGMALTSKHKFVPLSPRGARAVSQISEAGERGDWHQARHVYSAYSGAEIPVFSAAMHAAIRCDQYKQGALIYSKLCSLNINRTAPAFTSALTIHSKLGNKDAVREIWTDAMRECDLDAALAAARISAAAAEGDVQTAATVLDQMNVRGVAIDVGHLSAAIRACWEAEGSHHNAAKYLFNLHKELHLQPNVITFACLIGAYMTAPLEEVLVAYTEMKELGILPNTVFAESYLVTVLRKPKKAPWDEDEMLDALHTRSPERIAAARQAIDDFKAEGVSLSTLSSRIHRDSNFESPSKDMSSIEATSPIEQASSYKLHPAAAAQQAAKEEEDHYDYEQPALSAEPELPETQDIGQPQEAEEQPPAAADVDAAASSEGKAQPAEEETYDMPAADKLSEVCKDLRAEAEKTDAAASTTGAQPSDLDYRTPDMYLNPQGPEPPSGQASRQTSRDMQPVRRQWVQTQPQLPSAAAAAAAAATAVRQTSPDMKTSPELPVSVSRQDSAYSASGYSQSNSPSVPYRHFSGRILTPRESSGNISVVSNGRPDADGICFHVSSWQFGDFMFTRCEGEPVKFAVFEEGCLGYAWGFEASRRGYRPTGIDSPPSAPESGDVEAPGHQSVAHNADDSCPQAIPASHAEVCSNEGVPVSHPFCGKIAFSSLSLCAYCFTLGPIKLKFRSAWLGNPFALLDWDDVRGHTRDVENMLGPAAEKGGREVKLFVGRLPREVTRQQLQQAFQPYGPVLEVFIISQQASSQLGCAFVRLPSLEQAQRAVHELHDKPVPESSLFNPLQVALAKGEAERLGLGPDIGEAGKKQDLHQLATSAGLLPVRTLVDLVKEGQRKSAGFKQKWRSFCEFAKTQGVKSSRPSKHPAGALAHFVGTVAFEYGNEPWFRSKFDKVPPRAGGMLGGTGLECQWRATFSGHPQRRKAATSSGPGAHPLESAEEWHLPWPLRCIDSETQGALQRVPKSATLKPGPTVRVAMAGQSGNDRTGRQPGRQQAQPRRQR